MNKLLLFLLFIFTLNIFSQRETDYWYFGNKAGLKFNYYDIPSAVLNNVMQAQYGTASISDKNGNLLFYTSGSFVYNKEHYKMNNGDLLASDNEVLQTSIIVPKPNSSNIYYLITLKNSNTPPKLGPLISSGLYYSVIDMSEDRGLGKVIDKNISLTPLASEKLTAVHAKDGKSIWIISFGKKLETETKFDTFYSFKIDENGVSTAPIISSMNSSFLNNKGAIKAAPNGKFLLLSNTSNAILTDFDTETGKINTRKLLRISHGEGMQGINSRPKTYGIEFSQDSKYIYIETIDQGQNIIFQYNTEDINKRQEVHISSNPKNYMQLAKDGNIYITTAENERTGGSFLSKISPPKNSDETLATYSENAINLNGKKSNLGLPNFIQSYFRTRIITENGCINNNTIFKVDTYANITASAWDFGDGNTSTEIEPKYVYTSPGIYTVSCIITINNREIYISKEIEIYTPDNFTITNKNIIQCDIDNDGTDFFNLTDIKDFILESDLIAEMRFYKSLLDAQNDDDEIENSTNFVSTGRKEIFIRIYNDNGCYVINNFFIESAFVKLGNVKDFYTCSISEDYSSENIGIFDLNLKETEIRTNLNLNNDVKIRFYPDSQSAQINKNELTDDFTSKSTSIWVRADTPLGCGGIESFNLTVNNLPKIGDINNTYTICFNPDLKPPIILSAHSNNDRFEWRNSFESIISTNKDFTLNQIGNYSITVYKTENGIECSFTKEFIVKNPEEPKFAEIIVNTEDETNNTLDVKITGNSTYEFSLDNINFFGNTTSYQFTKVIPGLKTVYIRDINNCENPIRQKVSVLGVQEFFTPNGDGKNDFWNIRGLNPDFYKSVNIQIFDRFGRIVAIIYDFNSLGWDGRTNGKMQKSNDYWYKIEIIDIDDNLIKKTGNFTLIRK